MKTIKLTSTKESDIAAALASLTEGGTVILPPGKTIKIETGLVINVCQRHITLDVNGAILVDEIDLAGSTLEKRADVRVITVQGCYDTPVPVIIQNLLENSTVVKYSSTPSNLKVNDWVKIISDDPWPYDKSPGARMGQALQVQSISGQIVTFKGKLIEGKHYTLNVRASTMRSGKGVIKNGTVRGNPNQNNWKAALVELRSVIQGHVDNITLRDNFGRGINVVNGVNNVISNVKVRNLQDPPALPSGANPTLAIGISSLSSTGTHVIGYYAEDVTHSADNNAIKPSTPEQYGADLFMRVEQAVIYKARDFAFSWHPQGAHSSFSKVQAFDCLGFLHARGVNNAMTNSQGAGNKCGLFIEEWGNGDAKNITIDNVILKDTQSYALDARYPSSPGGSRNNKLTNSYIESKLGNKAAPSEVNTAGTNFNPLPATTITATAPRPTLIGSQAADAIAGDSQGNYIWSGQQADNITGGSGNDRFVYHDMFGGIIGIDSIQDFKPGQDVIDLSIMAAKYDWKPGDPIANGYVAFQKDGPNLKVFVSHSGAVPDRKQIATLSKVSGLVPSNILINPMNRLVP